MPLLRLSSRQLAANRANAQKSTGPRTPGGKARSAQNACKHRLYARTYTVPPTWHERITAQVAEATVEFDHDSRERDLRARFLYLLLWAGEVDSLADQYFQLALYQCGGDFRGAVRQWYMRNPLSEAFQKRRMHISRQLGASVRDLDHYLARPTAPEASAEPTRNSHITNPLPANSGTVTKYPCTPLEPTTKPYLDDRPRNNRRQAAPAAAPHPVHDSKVPTPITLQVNGAPRTASAPENITLLDFLRHHLHLTGAKYGCGEGACGACTVLIENRPVQACTISAASVQNRKITTIEGLAQNAKLHPVQQAFLDAEAFQCGYCTPAMILAAAALLHEYPNPPAALIREKLEGHLCRCGAYPRIVEAVRLAAKLEAARAQ